MSKKHMKEWFVDVPWGKLAMVSWGDASKPPVLMVHGYVDTAATFLPLVELLPNTFYYVSFDLPGHGLSDAAPGPPVSYVHFADIIRHVVDRMDWDTFICIAHSMGYLISGFYNAVFPGKMVKMVNLDGAVGFGVHAVSDHYPQWFEHSYARYYRNLPASKQVTYTYEEAIALLKKARGATDKQAAILATRCLAVAEDRMYRFTWDPKVKKIGSMGFTFDSLCAIFATDIPTLNVFASEHLPIYIDEFKQFSKKMVEKLQRVSSNYFVLNVKGGHDVHFTNPDSFVEFVIEFMNTDFAVKSKL